MPGNKLSPYFLLLLHSSQRISFRGIFPLLIWWSLKSRVVHHRSPERPRSRTQFYCKTAKVLTKDASFPHSRYCPSRQQLPSSFINPNIIVTPAVDCRKFCRRCPPVNPSVDYPALHQGVGIERLGTAPFAPPRHVRGPRIAFIPTLPPKLLVRGEGGRQHVPRSPRGPNVTAGGVAVLLVGGAAEVCGVWIWQQRRRGRERILGLVADGAKGF